MQTPMRPAFDATIKSLTEAEMAFWLKERGSFVVNHRGRYWLGGPPGFFQAVDWLARMDSEEATRPKAWCWGFRTPLCEKDAHLANATLPVHLMKDIEGYGMDSLSSRQRNKVRNCQKRVEFVQILQPDLLHEQGYEVVLSAQKRNGYGKVLTLRQYRKDIRHYFNPSRSLVLGGLIDGKLGGYIVSHAVGSTAYVDQIHLATESLHTNIGLGLFFEWMQVCQRSGIIREVVHSPHVPENAGLTRHKKELGFSVTHIPTRVWFMPMAEEFIRKRRPHAYYRLTGHD